MNARKAKMLRRAARMVKEQRPGLDERRVHRRMKKMATSGTLKPKHD